MYIHTHIHTYMHTYIHTHSYTHVHGGTQTHAQARVTEKVSCSMCVAGPTIKKPVCSDLGEFGSHSCHTVPQLARYCSDEQPRVGVLLSSPRDAMRPGWTGGGSFGPQATPDGWCYPSRCPLCWCFRGLISSGV